MDELRQAYCCWRMDDINLELFEDLKSVWMRRNYLHFFNRDGEDLKSSNMPLP